MDKQRKPNVKIDQLNRFEYIASLNIHELANFLDIIISDLQKRQGVFTEAEAFLTLAASSLRKEEEE